MYDYFRDDSKLMRKLADIFPGTRVKRALCCVASLCVIPGTACVDNFDDRRLEPIAEVALIATNLDENVPPNALISLQFSNYLAPGNDMEDAIAVVRQGRRLTGPVEASIFRRTLSFAPSGLQPETDYILVIDPAQLRDVYGRPLGGQLEVPFRTSATDVTPPTPVAPVRFDVIDPILVDGCSCHAEQPTLPPLDYRGLLERTSQTGRPFVVPFAPQRSYLLMKVIADYPDRSGARMPPPFHGPALDDVQIALIEQWIRTGAQE